MHLRSLPFLGIAIVAVLVLTTAAASAATNPSSPAHGAVVSASAPMVREIAQKAGDGKAAAPDQSFSCGDYSGSYSDTAYYSTETPFPLEYVVWSVIGGGAFCEGVVAISISDSLSAVAPGGGSHTIGEASCSECTATNAWTNEGYTCTGRTACAGQWTIVRASQWVLAPDDDFAPAPGCVLSGPTDNIQTCEASSEGPDIPAYNS
jgi:hypothetical protein